MIPRKVVPLARTRSPQEIIDFVIRDDLGASFVIHPGTCWKDEARTQPATNAGDRVWVVDTPQGIPATAASEEARPVLQIDEEGQWYITRFDDATEMRWEVGGGVSGAYVATAILAAPYDGEVRFFVSNRGINAGARRPNGFSLQWNATSDGVNAGAGDGSSFITANSSLAAIANAKMVVSARVGRGIRATRTDNTVRSTEQEIFAPSSPDNPSSVQLFRPAYSSPVSISAADIRIYGAVCIASYRSESEDRFVCEALSRLVFGRNMSVTPENFGAVGDGVADDTLAVQAAVNSSLLVRGTPNSVYVIDGQRAQWSPFDLHRIGSVPPGTPIFSEGYWYGVRVRDHGIVEHATFSITRWSNEDKAGHAFAFGTPDSSRRSHNEMRQCVFKVFSSFGGTAAPGDGPQRLPRAFLAQSVDNFMLNVGLQGYDADNPMNGGFLFDCDTPSLHVTNAEFTNLHYVLQFCNNIIIENESLNECNAHVDLDKSNSNVLYLNNTYIREASPDNPSVDSVIEVNGVDGIDVTGNSFAHPRRGIIYNSKSNIANTWAGALVGTASPIFKATKNLYSQNTITDASNIAVSVGSTWAAAPHSGEAGTANVEIADTIVGGTTGLLVNECDGLAFTGSISNCSGVGIHLRGQSQIEAVLKANIGGTVLNTAGSAILAESINELVLANPTLNGGLPVIDIRQANVKNMTLKGSATIEHATSNATPARIASIDLADGEYIFGFQAEAEGGMWLGHIEISVASSVATASLVVATVDNPAGLGGVSVDTNGATVRIYVTGNNDPAEWTFALNTEGESG